MFVQVFPPSVEREKTIGSGNALPSELERHGDDEALSAQICSLLEKVVEGYFVAITTLVLCASTASAGSFCLFWEKDPGGSPRRTPPRP